MMSVPVFPPFIIDNCNTKPRVTRQRPLQQSTVVETQEQPRNRQRQQLPAPRQRYRVIQPVSSSIPRVNSNIHDPRYRRPKSVNGSGQLLGTISMPETSFTKTANFLPSKTKKRVFFPEEDTEIRHQPGGRLVKVRRMANGQIAKDELFTEDSDQGLTGSGIGTVAVNVEVQAEPSTSGEEKPHVHSEVEYQEEDVDIDTLEEEVRTGSPEGASRLASGAAPEQTSEFRGKYTIQLPQRLRSTSAVRQLYGENSYLKDQLDACYYRIRQLEALLTDRNTRVKTLLTENLKMSSKIKRLAQELGEDAANEILGC